MKACELAAKELGTKYPLPLDIRGIVGSRSWRHAARRMRAHLAKVIREEANLLMVVVLLAELAEAVAAVCSGGGGGDGDVDSGNRINLTGVLLLA